MKRSISFIASGILMLSCMLSCGSAEEGRNIRKVEKITVETPEGTVPRLPYQVWVTYSDGTEGYRQVRWSNSALVTEKEQAAYPAGKKYTVEGFVTGDKRLTSNRDMLIEQVLSWDITQQLLKLSQPIVLYYDPLCKHI